MKKWTLCLFLALCVLFLAGCQSNSQQGRYEVISNQGSQNLYEPSVTAVPQTASGFSEADVNQDFDDGSYDPSSEENDDEDTISISIPQQASAAQAATAAPTMNSEYAGATPVVIDPIDKPTPTPLPKLTFTYETYTASKLHLSFDGPSGWTVDDVAGDTYILTNPDASTGYQAYVSVRTSSVNGSYTTSELRTEVRQMLQTIKTDGSLKSFSTSQTATRTLMKKNGVYANYTAVTPEGIEIAGRVHVVNVDKTLYVLHVSYPLAYRETYVENVYHKIRDTLKAV